MENEQNKNMTDMKKLKEIPKWTKKYVQNRMLTNFVFLIIYVVLYSGIYVPLYLDEVFFKNDNVIAKSICKIVSLSLFMLLLYISIPNWGGLKLWKWVEQRIYREGNISLPEPILMRTNKKIGKIAGLLFCTCITFNVFLYGYIPKVYIQPVSAIYCVPFAVFLYLWQRPKYGPLILIWPALYTIHAILIVAGVPIVFPKESGLVSLDIFIPAVGYGFLTFVIIYIYNRYALKKLKAITHIEGNTADGD
jgi:hypothetical protein